MLGKINLITTSIAHMIIGRKIITGCVKILTISLLPWILGADGSSELGLWGGVAYIGLCRGLRTFDVGLDLIRRLHCWSFCVKVNGVS